MSPGPALRVCCEASLAELIGQPGDESKPKKKKRETRQEKEEKKKAKKAAKKQKRFEDQEAKLDKSRTAPALFETIYIFFLWRF